MGEGHVGVSASDWLPRPVVSSLGTCPRLGLERGALGTPGGSLRWGGGLRGLQEGRGSAVSGEKSGAGSSDAA